MMGIWPSPSLQEAKGMPVSRAGARGEGNVERPFGSVDAGRPDAVGTHGFGKAIDRLGAMP
jgi:hypothetical protein